MNEKLTEILNNANPKILKNPGVNLVEAGILDSLTIMRIVSDAEDAFGFDFDPDDIFQENFASVDAIRKTIKKYGIKLDGES